MKELEFENDGRPRANNDLRTLQSETFAVLNGFFLDLPQSCVVQGCNVTDNGGSYDVAPGLVYLNGFVVRFDGASGVVLPGELYLGPVVKSDLRPYKTGGSKYCMTEQKALFRAYTVDSPGLVKVTADGVLDSVKAREGLARMNGETKLLAKVAATWFDNDGRGKYGTKAYGWHFANGAGGTEDPRGRVPVVVDARDVDFNVLGKKGGVKKVALTADEGPIHTHEMDGAGEHQHGLPSNVDSTGNGSNNFQNFTRSGQANAAGEYNMRTKVAGSHTHQVRNAGGGQAHENLQPYYSFVLIEWIGF
jgi:microcystin-dependent protein